jgi:nucleoside permease NupC
MVAKTVFRVMVIGFFGMMWAFIIMPGLEAVGMRFTTLDRIISYIVAPLAGLITSQILLRRVRD